MTLSEIADGELVGMRNSCHMSVNEPVKPQPNMLRRAHGRVQQVNIDDLVSKAESASKWTASGVTSSTAGKPKTKRLAFTSGSILAAPAPNKSVWMHYRTSAEKSQASESPRRAVPFRRQVNGTTPQASDALPRDVAAMATAT